VTLTNFAVRRLTPEEQEFAKRFWADSQFLPSNEYWLADFDLDGVKRQAGVRGGRRFDAAEDMDDQFDIELRDEDSPHIPETEVADIIRLVGEQFRKGEYWKRP
jgi:hypothetical protein